MYRYDEFDHRIVSERVEELKDQVARRLSGELSEDQFKPLRLMNGVYLQLHAYMLRVAIPYGTLSSEQMRGLAHVARTYDKGYGHFTTRQNIQYNWPRLVDIPLALEDLAQVQMHAIQTSGACIRNVTSDPYAGAAADEIEDPRPYAEIMRQWSTFHPEFTYLPRKFKIAITGATYDRAAVQFHDIGIEIVRNDEGAVGFRIWVGGGLGRTPVVGKVLKEFVDKTELLNYLEAALRVYNRYGRRDNKYKARIKILVNALGIEEYARLVEEEYGHIAGRELDLPQAEIDRIKAYFAKPDFKALPAVSEGLAAKRAENPAFDEWVKQNITAHTADGYSIVAISLSPAGGIPGDASDAQMELVADLSDKHSFGEIRVTHEQNLVLPHVPQDDLYTVYEALVEVGLAEANLGHISDIICCPGLDYCNLANARSINVSQDISSRFGSAENLHKIGKITLNISGCINACGHHHVGNIGILGVDKRGSESYQLTLGGAADNQAAIGKITGPGFPADKIGDAVETVVNTYLSTRENNEDFIDTYRRVGMQPFKEALYGTN